MLRIINTDTIILRTVINTCLNDAHNGRVNWFSEVKYLLSKYVFLYVTLEYVPRTTTSALRVRRATQRATPPL